MAKPDTAPNAPVLDENDNVVNPNADQEAVAGTTTVAASADNDDVVAPTDPIQFDGTASADERAAADAEVAATARERAEDTKEAAEKQRAEDEAYKAANPDVPLVREANPEVGGE